MAIAYASDYTTGETISASGTLTLTKPSGLAAGDLMLAFFNMSSAQSPARTGWTVLLSTDDIPFRCLWKVASAGDVSGGNFAFTGFAESDDVTAAVCRITGDSITGADNMKTDLDFVGSTTTPTYSGGVTTVADGDLLLLGAAIGDDQNVSSQAVANNNPSWTEQFDIKFNSAVDSGLSISSASYATQGSTGDYSLTIAASAASVGFLISITEDVSVTPTPAVITATASVQAPAVTAGATVTTAVVDATASVQAPTVSAGTAKWTNKAKSSAPTWTNKAKS